MEPFPTNNASEIWPKTNLPPKIWIAYLAENLRKMTAVVVRVLIHLPVNKKKIRAMIMVYPKYRMVLARPVICSLEKK